MLTPVATVTILWRLAWLGTYPAAHATPAPASDGPMAHATLNFWCYARYEVRLGRYLCVVARHREHSKTGGLCRRVNRFELTARAAGHPVLCNIILLRSRAFVFLEMRLGGPQRAKQRLCDKLARLAGATESKRGRLPPARRRSSPGSPPVGTQLSGFSSSLM